MLCSLGSTATGGKIPGALNTGRYSVYAGGTSTVCAILSSSHRGDSAGFLEKYRKFLSFLIKLH